MLRACCGVVPPGVPGVARATSRWLAMGCQKLPRGTTARRLVCGMIAFVATLAVALVPSAVAYQTDAGISFSRCPAMALGTEAADVVSLDESNDGFEGLGGNDQLFGFGGNDCLIGNFGSDITVGHSGNDVVSGGPGEDELYGTAGNDDIEALEFPSGSRSWQDTVIAGTGDDDIKADDGFVDAINCGSGQDRVDADAVDSLVSCERQVDLIGRDVYHARQWTGDPAAGGELVSEEWAVAGTKIARRETSDTINTRTNVPCQDGYPGGPWCAEVRWRTLESQFEGAGPDDQDGFMQHRGASQEDPNIDQIAEVLDPMAIAAAGHAPTTTGPLGAVLGNWQVPPPGHGSTYEAYEASGPLAFSSGLYDETAGEFSDGIGFGSVTVRVSVDAATRMPIRTTISVHGETFSYYWSYDPSVAPPGAFPPDFFLVAPPAQAALNQSVEFRAAAPPANLHDTGTATTFAPYNLGARTVVAGRPYCLLTTLVFRQTERRENELGPPKHDLSSLTRVDALYAPQPAGSSCRPGAGSIEDAALNVSSVARNSGVAAAYRDSVVPRARTLPAPPSPPRGLTFGPTAPFEGARNAAFTAPAAGGGRLALADVGATTVLINGDFAAGQAAELLSNLEGR